MDKLNIKEIIKDMEENRSYMYFEGEWYKDLADNFAEYDSGYICDIISQVADNWVDIHTHDLMQWNAENYSYVEEAIQEFGTPNEFDMVKAIQMGQYLCYERAMYNNLDWCIKLAILKNIQAEEISENILERIEEIANEEDSNEELENIIQEVEDKIKEEQEEQGAE